MMRLQSEEELQNKIGKVYLNKTAAYNFQPEPAALVLS